MGLPDTLFSLTLHYIASCAGKATHMGDRGAPFGHSVIWGRQGLDLGGIGRHRAMRWLSDLPIKVRVRVRARGAMRWQRDLPRRRRELLWHRDGFISAWFLVGFPRFLFLGLLLRCPSRRTPGAFARSLRGTQPATAGRHWDRGFVPVSRSLWLGQRLMLRCWQLQAQRGRHPKLELCR